MPVSSSESREKKVVVTSSAGVDTSSSTSESVARLSSLSIQVTRSLSTPLYSIIASPYLSTSSTHFSPENPLVAAGLIPEELSDILITPPEDAVVAKKRTKHIVRAIHLTSDDYAQMLRDEERKRKKQRK